MPLSDDDFANLGVGTKPLSDSDFANLGAPKTPPPGYWERTQQAGQQALETINRTLNPFSQAHQEMRARQAREGMTLGETLGGDTMSGLLAAPGFVGKAVTGAVAQPLAHLEAAAIEAAGYPIRKGIELFGSRPAPAPSHEQIVGDIEPEVETGVGLMAPVRGMPTAGSVLRPSIPPAPTIPPRPTPQGPLGVMLSEGQTTGDLTAIRTEQGALRGGMGQTAQQRAQAFRDQQADQLAQAHDEVSRGLSQFGANIAETPQEAGELVSRGVQRAAQVQRALVDLEYTVARAHPGEIHAGVFENMGSRIKGDLSMRDEPVIVDDHLTPYASRMLQDVDNRIAQLRIQNRADPFGAPNPENIVGVNLQGVDQMRKRLSSFRRQAFASGNAADGRAAQAVIDSFDSRIDHAMNNGLFTGNPLALDAWNNARAAYADYRGTFTAQPNDPVGRVIERITGRRGPGPATGNDVADFLFGSQGVNPNTLNLAVARRVRDIMGANSPEWSAVKQGLFSRLTETPTGVTDWGPGNIANRLNRFLHGDGLEMANEMFAPHERQLLQTYADLQRSIAIPPGGANWSGSGYEIAPLLRRISNRVGGLIGGLIGHTVAPGLGGMGEVAGTMAGARASEAVENARNMRDIIRQMPLLGEQIREWQRAASRSRRIANPAVTATALANVAERLRSMGIPDALRPHIEIPVPGHAQDQQQEVPRPPPQQHDGGKVEEPHRAHGGKVDAKVSKASVHYRGGVKDRRCGVCTMYVKPNGCTAVRGSISPHALCDLFERKH